MTTHRLGTLGALWAAAYLPVHVLWALGGATAPFGLTDLPPGWRLANLAACVLIAGAGLLCLALTRAWGAVVPARRGVAYVAGSIALAHWAVFSVQLPLSGLDRWTWWNLLVFEPWFGVTGALLVVLARRATPRPTPPVATAVVLGGVAVTVAGTIVFSPWLFLVAGPLTTVVGAALSYLRTTTVDAPGRRDRTRRGGKVDA